MFGKLERLLDIVGVLCVAMLFTLTVVQVVLRYGHGQLSFFTEELARFFLIWATMIGVAIEARNGRHIRIPFVLEYLPERLRRWWYVTGEVLTLSLFVMLAWLGTESTIFNHGQESPGLQVPLSIPFVAIPLLFAIAAVFQVERLLRHQEATE